MISMTIPHVFFCHVSFQKVAVSQGVAPHHPVSLSKNGNNQGSSLDGSPHPAGINLNGSSRLEHLPKPFNLPLMNFINPDIMRSSAADEYLVHYEPYKASSPLRDDIISDISVRSRDVTKREETAAGRSHVIHHPRATSTDVAPNNNKQQQLNLSQATFPGYQPTHADTLTRPTVIRDVKHASTNLPQFGGTSTSAEQQMSVAGDWIDNLDLREIRNTSLPNYEQLKESKMNGGGDGRDLSLTIRSDPGASASLPCLGESVPQTHRRFLPNLTISDEFVEEKLNSLSARLERKLKVKSKERLSKKTHRRKEEIVKKTLPEDKKKQEHVDISTVGLAPEAHHRISGNNGRTLPGDDVRHEYEITYSNGAIYPSSLSSLGYHSLSSPGEKDERSRRVDGSRRHPSEFDDVMSMTSLEVADILSTADPLHPSADSAYEEPSTGGKGDRGAVSDEEDSGGRSGGSDTDIVDASSSSDDLMSARVKTKWSSDKPKHSMKTTLHKSVGSVLDQKGLSTKTNGAESNGKLMRGDAAGLHRSMKYINSLSTLKKSEKKTYVDEVPPPPTALFQGVVSSKQSKTGGSAMNNTFPGSHGNIRGGVVAPCREKVLSLYQLMQTRQLYAVSMIRDTPSRRLAFEVFNDVLYLETMTSSRGGATASKTREIVKQRFTVPVVGETRTGGANWQCSGEAVQTGDIIIEV